MASNFNIRNYMRNATKSVAYIATTSLGNVSPALTNFASTNKDFLKEMKDNVRDFKKNSRSGMDKITNDAYTQVATDFVKNTVDDFKSGKWYNKEREEKAFGEMFGLDFDDWDMDLGEDELGSIGDDDKYLAKSFDNVGAKIAQASAKATLESGQYVARANNASTRALMSQNEALTGKLTSGLATVNSTIASLAVSIIDPLQKHIDNSTKFYETTTKLLQDQNIILANMNTMFQERYAPSKKTSYKQQKGYGHATSGDMVDLNGYFDIIKGNVKEMTDMYTGLIGMMDMGGKRGVGAKAITASPISTIIGLAAEGISKQVMGDSLDKFNKTLQGFFGSIIMKVNSHKNDMGIKGLLADIFGIKSNLKKEIDTSKYEKGRVDFDGITRKSIIEVIPTQLSKIVSALTGEPEKRFDYKTGKFITVKSIKQQREKMTRSYSNSASSDMQGAFRDYASENISFKSRKDQDNFYSQMEKFFENLYTQNKMYDYKKFDNKNASKMAKEYGDIDPAVLKIISEFYKANRNTGKGYLNLGINGNIMDGRSSQTRALQQEEADGNSIYTHLYNNSGGYGKDKRKRRLGMLGVEDDKGNDIFFYLQNFYSDLKKIASNGGGNGRGGGGINTNSKSYDVPNNKNRSSDQSNKSKNDKILDEIFQSRNKYNTGKVDFDEFSNMNSEDIQSRLKETSGYKNTRDIKEKSKKEFMSLYNSFIQKGMSEEDAEAYASSVSGYSPKSFGKNWRRANTLGEKISSITDRFKDKFNPSKGAVKILESVDTYLYRMVYGKEDDPESGNSIIGKLFNKIDEGFDNFFGGLKDKALDFFKKIFGLDKGLDWLFGTKDEDGKRSGGKLSPFIGGVKKEFSGAKTWVKDAVSSTGRAIVEPFKKKSGPIPNAFHGGRVRRTGIAAVSEGEMIIPSEYNPFYSGTNNKSIQHGRENLAKRRYFGKGSVTSSYFGNFADGTESVGDDPKDDKYKDLKDFIKGSFGKINEGVTAGIHRVFGDSKTDNKFFSEAIKDVMGNIGSYAPGLTTGALIGGGVSLVGGLVGGPLLGAAAGAATSLVMKSEKIQKMLFGDVDDDGDRTGGILSKKMSNFITKKFPSLAKFAATGALTAMIPGIPGGPIAGLLLGSALNMASDSEGIKSFLFGAKDNDGNRYGGKIDLNAIKKILPSIGAGAIAGIVGGPFGIVGNIMMGSALGYVSTTDKFKEGLFGVKDEKGEYHGGVLGGIKEEFVDPLKQYINDTGKKANDWLEKKVFKPIEDAIQPLGKQLEIMVTGAGKALIKEFSHTITVPLAKKLQSYLFHPLRKLIGGTVGNLVMPAIKTLATPFRAIGAAGAAAKRSQVKSGMATYMTAKERIAYRQTNELYDKDSFGKFDQLLTEMDPDQLNQLRGVMRNEQASYAKLGKDVKTNSKKFQDALTTSDLTLSGQKRLTKLANKQDFDGLSRAINNMSISDDAKEKLLTATSKFKGDVGDYENRRKEINSSNRDLRRKLADAGVVVEDENFKKLLDLADAEAKASKKGNRKTEKKDPQEDIKENTTNIADEMIKANKYLAVLTGMADKDSLKDMVEGTGSKTVSEASGKTTKQIITDNGDILQIETDQKSGNSELSSKDAKTKEFQDNKKDEIKDRKAIRDNLGHLSVLDKISNFFKDNEGEEGKGEPGLFSKMASSIGMGFASIMNPLTHIISTGLGMALKAVLPSILFASLGSFLGGGKMSEAVKGAEDRIRGRDEEDKKNYELQYSTDTVRTGLMKKIVTGTNYSGMFKTYGGKGIKGVAQKLSHPTQGLKYGFKTMEFARDFAVKGAKSGVAGIKKIGSTIADTSIGKVIKGKASGIVSKIFDTVDTPLVKATKEAVQSLIASGMPIDEAIEVAGKKVGATVKKVGKSGMSFIVKEGTGEAAEMAAKATLSSTLKGGVSKLLLKIAKYLPDGVASAITEKFIPALTEKLAKSGTKLAKLTPKMAAAFTPAAIVLSAWEFVNGYQDARSILGIFDKPTIFQRVVAGLVRGLMSFIPIVGTLIPSEWVISAILNILGALPLLKNMVQGILDQRKDAKNTLDEYNKANGSNLSKRDYIKNILENGTIEENLFKAAGKGIKNVWNYVTGNNTNTENFSDPESKYVDSDTKSSGTTTVNTTYDGMNMTMGENGNLYGTGTSSHSVKSKSSSSNALYRNPNNNRQKNQYGGSSFISQKDPRYAHRKYGKSATIGQYGCGPAVAAMAVNQARGTNVSLSDAANYATYGGYVAGSSGIGTRSDYFGDYFASNGLVSNYTNKSSDIMNSISSGKPTVVLGQNNNNKSKSSSPFGPNPHYVVASGFDRSGNVIVNDPELNGPVKYNKNILKSAKLGIGVGGDSALDNNMTGSIDLPKDAARKNAATHVNLNNNGEIYDTDSNTKTTSDKAVNGDYIGRYVKQFESGTKGPYAVSTGKGDRGGMSFGSYQFASNRAASDNLYKFWDKYYKSKYPNAVPGATEEFKKAWIAAVDANPTEFAKNEHDYMVEHYYNPFKHKSGSYLNPDTYDRSAQEVAWSSAIQFGPESAVELFKKALGSKSPTSLNPKDFINRIQDYKVNNVKTLYRSSSESTQKGVANRHNNGERQALLSIAGTAPISPDSNPSSNEPMVQSDNSGNTSPTRQNTGVGGFLDNLFGNIFKSGFNKITGGDESKTNALLNIFGFGEENQNIETSNNTGIFGGTLPKNALQAQKLVLDKVFSIEGKNDYDQTKRYQLADTLIGKKIGYGDCSATTQWAYKEALGINPGGDTGAQIVSERGTDVDKGNGTGPNESNLQPGDLLFYKRSGSSKPQGVGHVEMYIGNSQRIGHGSGMGPKRTPINSDMGNYIKARRFITPQNLPEELLKPVDPIATYPNKNIPSTQQNHPSLIPTAPRLEDRLGAGSGIPMAHDVLNFAGRQSSMNVASKATVSNVSRSLRTQIGAGTSSDQILQVIIKAIEVLQKISDNTGKINMIISVLTNYFNSKLGTQTETDTTATVNPLVASTAVKQARNEIESSNPNPDQDLKDLMNMLKSIAA